MTDKDDFKTKVVFRKYRDNGDILALFPDVPFSSGCIMSYEHTGQHGGAHYGHCIARTKPATEKEYEALRAELESIGYDLEIKKRR